MCALRSSAHDHFDPPTEGSRLVSIFPLFGHVVLGLEAEDSSASWCRALRLVTARNSWYGILGSRDPRIRDPGFGKKRPPFTRK